MPFCFYTIISYMYQGRFVFVPTFRTKAILYLYQHFFPIARPFCICTNSPFQDHFVFIPTVLRPRPFCICINISFQGHFLFVPTFPTKAIFYLYQHFLPRLFCVCTNMHKVVFLSLNYSVYYRSRTIVQVIRHRFTVVNMNSTPVPIGQIYSFHSYI